MQDMDSTAAEAPPRDPEWRIARDPVPYPEAIAVMQTRVASIREGRAPELVWLLEHPPLYTAGSSARPADLADPDRFQTFQAGRGGQWTYHGPGQLVAYVMLDLARRHGSVPPRDTHAYVAGLEAWLIATLAAFDVRGERRDGRIGVWVADARTGAENKVASIGVRVTRWVTWHGVSLNVCPELDHFSGIVPCGIREHGVTSLKSLGVAASLQDVRHAMHRAWAGVFADDPARSRTLGESG
jgi:lipoyl(octanoyl) transferase